MRITKNKVLTHPLSIRIAMLALLLASGMIHAEAQIWQYPIVNYTRYDYGAGTQNWMFAQQDNGWIYVANNKGILEFDGERWRRYSAHGCRVRSVGIAPDGIVHAGAISEYGEFGHDDNGLMKYESVMRKINSSNITGVVRNILFIGNRVCYQDDRFFVMQEGDSLWVVNPQCAIYASALHQQRVHVATRDGLCVLKGDKLVPLPGTEALARYKVVCMASCRDHLLIATQANGLYVYDSDGDMNRLHTPADNFICSNLTQSMAVDGNRLAIGTIHDGIALIDISKGRYEKLSVENGLQNSTVLSLFFDREGNLWAGLDSGIDYIYLNSPVRHLYNKHARMGSGYTSCISSDKLYAGTNRGVVMMDLPDEISGTEDEPKFIEGIYGQIWQLTPCNDLVFCASDNGIFVIDKTNMAQMVPGCRGVRQIVPVPGQSNVMIAGCYGPDRGLWIIENNGGRWQIRDKVAGFEVSCKSLMPDPTDPGTVWFANKGNGVMKIRLTPDLCAVESMRTFSKPLLDTRHDFKLLTIDDNVVITSHRSLWQYDAAADTLVPATTLTDLTRHDNGIYTFLMRDNRHNLWYSDGQTLTIVPFDALRNKYEPEMRLTLLDGLMITNFEDVFVKGRHAVIASEIGFSLYNLDQGPYQRKLPGFAAVRRMYTTTPTDSLILGNDKSLANEVMPRIPYANNSIRFECSALNLPRLKPTLYSYRLLRNGSPGPWSEFTQSSTKDYTNLSEGKYTLQVKAKVDTTEDATASIDFCILPPWYRTWWGYALWALLTVAAITAVFLYFRHDKQKVVRQKEADMLLQEEAFIEENERKDFEIDKLKEENLKQEISRQQEAINRNLLNLIRKNEMMLNIKSDVLSIYRTIDKPYDESTMPSLKRKVLVLINKIKENMEHDDDLEKFADNFDTMHQGAITKLKKAFPQLTKKEILLCAYILMDLLSKEIAPLLNISVRGVEISRYRIRRKLDLPEGANLSEFLRNFINQDIPDA